MKNLKNLVVVAVLALFSNFASAQNTAPVNQEGIANGGYDVVSYFTVNKATKGSQKFTVEQNGAKYYFASAKNQKAFKANPKKYLPVCDGYCAWGVSEKQSKFPVNPETFKIVDGKLYLFFNGDFNGTPFNTLNEWNKDEKKQLNNIDAAWNKLKKS
ncbi:YHS domain-containing (seleno)protein [Flavobacterium soyangense]|uniref:YHS domain-containing protein n=1 Tax=Flavobacterium soyangense TaxID=2023265 RepID=A0A930U709_9FLAO|nr:YHS domain-containing (seleno)protein [Flavobacterium soyangense]MBF2708073.1 YHS domain-containing protein [Flavobacterium soyangense]